MTQNEIIRQKNSLKAHLQIELKTSHQILTNLQRDDPPKYGTLEQQAAEGCVESQEALKLDYGE